MSLENQVTADLCLRSGYSVFLFVAGTHQCPNHFFKYWRSQTYNIRLDDKKLEQHAKLVIRWLTVHCVLLTNFLSYDMADSNYSSLQHEGTHVSYGV